MKTLIRYCLITIAALAGLSSCIRNGGTGGAEFKDYVLNYVIIGDEIPEFTVRDKDGNTFTSSSFSGKRSLLFFFQTSCGDCQAVLPIVNDIWNTLKDEDGYMLVSINRAQTPAVVDKYFGEPTYNHPVYGKEPITLPYYLDPTREVFSMFADAYVPRFYIVDELGKVEWMATEKLPGNADTADKLLGLIRKE